jgi:hypothetical protein
MSVIIAAICILVIIVAVIIGVVVWLVVFKKPTGLSDRCEKACTSNRYCFKHNDANSSAGCECKPGYVENFVTKNCDQAYCYTRYTPYTYLDTYSDPTGSALSYGDRFLKPYCCPVAASVSSPAACCGIARSTQTFGRSSLRIIGGQQLSQSNVFPWLVYVSQVYRSEANGKLRLVNNCTGSLISDRHVLTAGHCMDLDAAQVALNGEFPTLESVIRIYFGFADKTRITVSGVNERRVVKIHRPTNYNDLTLENDLAVLVLDRPVLRDENADYICLFNYASDDSVVSGLKLYSAGWGSVSPLVSSLAYPNVANYVDLAVQPMSACKYIISSSSLQYLFNPNTHVCAGYAMTAGKDTCYGDSGAPLMVQLKNQWFIYGNNYANIFI